MKTFLFAGQMFGLSSKEIDVLVREMDDLPKDREVVQRGGTRCV